MGLNISTGGGDFTPWVKYNGKAGRWYTKGENGEVEIANPTFIADFDNIKTGWVEFGGAGQPPTWTPHKSLTEKVARPGDKAKEGFKVKLFSKASFGGVVEMMSNSMHLTNSIAEIYDQYETGRTSNAGKLPVIKCTGTTPMKDKLGTNYKPNFSIEKWVDRPAEFDAQETVKTAHAQVESVSEF